LRPLPCGSRTGGSPRGATSGRARTRPGLRAAGANTRGAWPVRTLQRLTRRHAAAALFAVALASAGLALAQEIPADQDPPIPGMAKSQVCFTMNTGAVVCMSAPEEEKAP